MAKAADATQIDFVALSQQDDPHPAYHDLRRREPVHWSPQLRGWVLTRYADCVELLKSPDFSADRISPFMRDLDPGLRERLGGFARSIKPWVLVLDPPSHTRIRSLMNRAFTPRSAEAMRARIEQLVDGLLARHVDRPRMDIVADLAYPLPAIVIADLLGVPREDREKFKAWSDDIAAFVGSFSLDPDVIARCQESLIGLEAYFRGLIEERRRRPGHDLLSTLLQARDQGDMLDDDELFANCAFLLFAGHETTTNLIGNGLFWSLRNPAQWQLLRRRPELVPGAVEEFLRYDSPVDRISRIATKDTSIAGHAVRTGDRVIALTSAANRDPAQFSDPDRLDVTRTDNRHLAFGLGGHFCFGAPLARVEAQAVFRKLAETFPSMRLSTAATQWTDTLGFRGLKALPVELG